jgi:hypothetical protein
MRIGSDNRVVAFTSMTLLVNACNNWLFSY